MSSHHGNRYGRSDEARIKVLHAADNLLAEIGFASVTMEGLARRAGVSKQTIYRWWPSKSDVLLSALCEDAGKRLTVGDTGDLRSDARAALRSLAYFLGSDDAGKVLIALRAHAALDAEFAQRFDAEFKQHQCEREQSVIVRGIRRGELASTTSVTLEHARLVGPVYDLAPQDLSIEVAEYFADMWCESVMHTVAP